MSEPTAARVRSSSDAHWYDKDGNPRHRVLKADGKGERATTITDAKKNGWLPSVTSIIKVLDKPALTSWLCEQAALAVLTAPRKVGEELDAFVKRVLQDERQQDAESRKAMDLGSDIHNALEACLTARRNGSKEIIPDGLRAYVEPVLALDLLKGRVISMEQVVVGDGYAGRFDLLVEGQDCLNLCDFKTAKRIPDIKYGPWSEHKIQLSAYAKTLPAQQRIRTWNIYISTTAPGEVAAMECEDWENTFTECFEPLVKIWQWQKSYKP